MKAVILYKPKSEHGTEVESFVRDFLARNVGLKMELINVDERDGIAMASLYDITSYPTILVLATDGSVVHMWQGDQMPLMDEVASYMFSM